MVTTIVAYILIVFFFALESRARIGQAARSLDRTASDRGSTALLVVGYLITGLGLVAALTLNSLQIGRLPYGPLVGWMGIAIAVMGMALRLWAYRTLGRFYTRTLRVSKDQLVVRAGAYRLIRHPGYAGVILMWLGAGLATMNWITLAVAAVVLLAAYHYRIQAEERMLAAEMREEYTEYRAQTRKLIPFLY